MPLCWMLNFSNVCRWHIQQFRETAVYTTPLVSQYTIEKTITMFFIHVFLFGATMSCNKIAYCRTQIQSKSNTKLIKSMDDNAILLLMRIVILYWSKAFDWYDLLSTYNVNIILYSDWARLI